MPAPITTAVTICNSALFKCGADKIQSLTQTTRAAIVCETLYQYIRDEVMGAYQWRFATKRVVLAPNATKPPFTYTYAYDIPNDCLRPLKMVPDDIDWIVENGQIFCNEASLNFIYIYRNTDESSWDARFCEAFAWRLAMELAMALTKSLPMAAAAEKSYNQALAQARAINAVIGTIPPLEADIWSSARRGFKNWRKQQGQTGDP